MKVEEHFDVEGAYDGLSISESSRCTVASRLSEGEKAILFIKFNCRLSEVNSLTSFATLMVQRVKRNRLQRLGIA